MQTVPTFSNFLVLNPRVRAIYVNKHSRTFRLKYPAPYATVKIMLIKMSKCVKQSLGYT